MESNKNLSQGSELHTTEGESGSISGKAASAATRAKEEVSNLKDRAGDVVDQTKQAVTNAYQETAQAIGSTYDQAVTYSRNNPGTAMLIAFGAGVGVGVLIAAGMPGRSRMNRIAEPIVTALSQVALEFIR